MYKHFYYRIYEMHYGPAQTGPFLYRFAGDGLFVKRHEICYNIFNMLQGERVQTCPFPLTRKTN